MAAHDALNVDDLLKALRHAGDPATMIQTIARAPLLLARAIEKDESPRTINRMTAEISDALLSALIEGAIDELGPPPAAFSFLVFGSVGRREQTLKTDQDNAIVYEDVSDDMAAPVRDYFLTLGKTVCTWLDQAGYTFCEGGNMALNSRYCQPLSIWKQMFSQWVCSAEDKDLLRVNIFFDFRNAWGAAGIEEDLRRHVEGIVVDNDRFFQILARNMLQMVTPLGLFGRLVVETEGPLRGSFNIKNAMMPIVDFARIYAMKHTLRSANTIDRLDELRDINILNDMSRDLETAYACLMQTRLRVQARAVIAGTVQPSNHVFPNTLSPIEQKQLKESFARIKAFKAKLSYDFIGRLN